MVLWLPKVNMIKLLTKGVGIVLTEISESLGGGGIEAVSWK